MKKISKILACFGLVLVVVLNVAVPCFALSTARDEDDNQRIVNSPSSFTVTRNLNGIETVTTYPMDVYFGGTDISSFTMNGTTSFWSAIGTRYRTFAGLTIERPWFEDTAKTVQITLNALSIPEDNGSNDFFSSVSPQSGFPLGSGSVGSNGDRNFNGTTSSVSGGYIQGRSFKFTFDDYVYDRYYANKGNSTGIGNCLVVDYMFYIPKGTTPILYDNSPDVFDGSIDYEFNSNLGNDDYGGVVLDASWLDIEKQIVVTNDPRYDLKVYTVKYWYERDIANAFYSQLRDEYYNISNPDAELMRLQNVEIELPYFPGNAGGVGSMGDSSPILPRFYCTYSDYAGGNNGERYYGQARYLLYAYDDTPDDGRGFLSWLIDAIGGFFDNFRIGGVKVAGILYLVMIVAVVKIFLKMFAGG